MPDPIIPGPYEFNEPPVDKMGWLQLDSAREFELVVATAHSPFISYTEYRRAVDEHNRKRGIDEIDEPEQTSIWQYIQQATGGHLKTWNQATGDCVGHGVGTGVETRQCVEIVKFYEEEQFRPVFRPYHYGMSRCAKDLGNGRLGNGAGSTGAWGAGAVRKYGTLFCDDERVPEYTKSVAEGWGRMPGPPQWARQLAADNPMGKTAKLGTIEQIRHELINRRPVTMAMMWDFEMQPREYRGYHVFRRGRTVGGHQTCLTEWRDEPFQGAYVQGSWGPNAHGTPLNGEQPGGAWALAEDLQHHLRTGYSEFFAFALFAGEPGEPDYGIL